MAESSASTTVESLTRPPALMTADCSAASSDETHTARERRRERCMNDVLAPLPAPGAPFSHTSSRGACKPCIPRLSSMRLKQLSKIALAFKSIEAPSRRTSCALRGCGFPGWPPLRCGGASSALFASGADTKPAS